MSFTSTTIVPLAAAGAGGESYYIAKYTYSGSVSGAGVTSKVETIVDLADDTLGLWSNCNVYYTTDVRGQNYTRVNILDGSLLTNKFMNADRDPNFRNAQWSTALGVQFVGGRFWDGSSELDAVGAFDRDGTQDGTYVTTDCKYYNPFAVHPTSGRIYYGSSDRLYGLTYTTGGGFAHFYEATYSEGGDFQAMAWQNDKLVTLINDGNDTYVNKYPATGSGTAPGSPDYVKQHPNSGSSFNELGHAPRQAIQADGSEYVFISDENNYWRLFMYDSGGTGYYQYSMNRQISYNSITTYAELRQVLVDQTRSTYVYSTGIWKWRPTWSGSGAYTRNRGSVLILQHNFNLTLNKAIAISLNTTSGVTSSNNLSYAGIQIDEGVNCMLRNNDEDLVIAFYGNKGANKKQDQELFVIKMPTDFSALTMGTYNGWKFEDVTSIINNNASPSQQSGTPYNRSYTLSSATPPSTTNDTINNMSAITISPTIVKL